MQKANRITESLLLHNSTFIALPCIGLPLSTWELGYCKNEICATLRFTAKDVQTLFDRFAGHQEMFFTL